MKIKLDNAGVRDLNEFRHEVAASIDDYERRVIRHGVTDEAKAKRLAILKDDLADAIQKLIRSAGEGAVQ